MSAHVVCPQAIDGWCCFRHVLSYAPLVYNGTYLLRQKKRKKIAKGGLRPSFLRKPTACGHPYAYPQDGRRYKALGGYAAEMGIRGCRSNQGAFFTPV